MIGGMIPNKPSDCSFCERQKAPCRHHLGPDGSFCLYTGVEMYEPSNWVQEVVGCRYYDAWREGIYLCTGYDRRVGFWMDRIDGGRRTNISERAIGRTWHPVKMSAGAWRMLDLSCDKGALITWEEGEEWGIIYDAALQTLKDTAIVSADGQLTAFSKKVLEIPKALRPDYLKYDLTP